MDRDMARAYDAYITREPDYPPEVQQPHCTQCFGFLSTKPEYTEEWEDGFDCDGTETFHEYPYEESTIRIIGKSYRGKTYTASVSRCGGEVGPHDPHRVIIMSGLKEFRICKKCGHVNIEKVM